MIQDVGSIELFELLETETKRSAQHAYHTGTSASSIAHADISCRKKQRPIEISSSIRWTYFLFQSMSSRREDLTATDMGESQETKNIIWLTNWKRNAKRWSSKESMTDSYEIMNSVCEWLNMIEMKKFVDDGCSCRWGSHSPFDHARILFYKSKWWLHSNNQGSDSMSELLQEQKVASFKKARFNTIPLRKRSDFKQALSTLERLHQEAGEEPFVPTYSYKHKQWQSASSSSSTWWKWQDSWCSS